MIKAAGPVLPPEKGMRHEIPDRGQDRVTPPMPWRWAASVLAGLLSGLAWAAVMWEIETQSLLAVLLALAAPQFWFTVLFLGLLVLAFSLLLHSLFAGNLIVGAAGTVLAFVNYFKELITTLPLNIGDFTLIGQVGQIARLNSASLTLSRHSLLAIAWAVLWLLLALFFSRPLRLRWGWSALGGCGAALAFALLFWAGVNPLVYRPLKADATDAVIPQRSVNQSCGVALGLWRALYLTLNRDLGEDYSLSHMESVLSEVRQAAADQPGWEAGKTRPNVILVLSESFFDVAGLDGVTFAEDPIADFRALKEEGVSGPFFTRTLGYGTCNIELEILTGINTGLLSGEDLYSLAPGVFTRLPSVPSLFQREGYYTAMLHTYDDSIYHRAGIFRRLGFDDLYFSSDFAAFYEPAAQAENYWTYMNTRLSGGLYSDDLMTDLLISLYEKHVEDGPVFLYGISMENHSPYLDKYSDEELTVSFDSPLTGEAADDLRNLSQGIHNASAALGKLADYFRTVDEPTVIVFFGDHRPGLGLSYGGTVYSELGIVPPDGGIWSPEDYVRTYSTDYLIWSNDPAYLPAEPGGEAEASCNHLGAELLELAGIDMPLYWRFIRTIAQDRVIDSLLYHRGRDGETSIPAPTEGAGVRNLSLFTDLLNDAVYGKQYVTEALS